jgi:hypothetical protein
MQSEETRQKLFMQGWQPVGTSSEGLRSRMKAEASEMGRVIAQRGIKVE